ncbi:MAG: glycosyltransferase family 2 protein [Planctomycetota bacterium]
MIKKTRPPVGLSVIIPVYNEEEAIGPLLEELREVLAQLPLRWEVVVVDDGSTDRTQEAIREQSADFPEERLRLVPLERNSGQTAAFDAGFKSCRGEIIVTMDGDGQNDPHDIPQLLERLDGYDAAYGVRADRRDSWLRHVSSQIANGVRNWILHTRYRDVGCSLKAFRRQTIEELPLYQGLHRFFPNLLEMRGYRGIEVEVSHRPRERGRSKYSSVGRAIPALLDCLMVRRMQTRRLRYRMEEEERR